MIKAQTLEFTSSEEGRVDKVASAFIPRTVFSREETLIEVNGEEVKKSFKVKRGDLVFVSYTEEVFEGLIAQDIPLKVIYEDEEILVIEKEEGILVHPGAGNYTGTIANALLNRYGDFIDDDVRPGIVHRLDKDTSGVMVIAKTDKALASLSAQFASHLTEKIYIAVAKGVFVKKRGTISKNIARSKTDRKKFEAAEGDEGKSAITHYTVLNQQKEYALLRIKIETGRTHQIRVHLKSIGHPVLGDVIYSKDADKYGGLMLHAFTLSFDHPATGERMTFRSRMPERIRELF